MRHVEFLDQPMEEILEHLWRQREEGPLTRDLREEMGDESINEILDVLREQELVSGPNGQVHLTPTGEVRARNLVRRHRLAERLLIDVFDLPQDESSVQACLLEHVLSPSVTDAVCTFLGHPPTCPHGLRVPAGDCCTARTRDALRPIVSRLVDLDPGEEGRIVFLAPGREASFETLGSFGVAPGTTLILRQKRPSFVVDVGGTSLALEKDVAEGIYMRREP